MIDFGIVFTANVFLVMLSRTKEKAIGRLATGGLLLVNTFGMFLMMVK